MLVPRPRSLSRRDGTVVLGPTSGVRGPGDLVALLRRELESTGLPLPAGEAPAIELAVDPTLGAEAYRLVADGGAVRIAGGDRAGVFYGVQTLRQLLPRDVYRRVAPPGTRWEMPAVEVEDSPRFRWRGGMLDVARHFMPREFLFRWVDLLALHKLNVFHLHLTDDQGWRFESRRYPRLQEVASWRAETDGDGRPHGGFYTQDDLRELVAYAAARHVVIVPEIDMPGHMQAAIAAYPELGNRPREPAAVGSRWGVMVNVLNLGDGAVRFCTDILDEVLEVFPAPDIHIGGDECPTTEWAASAQMADVMRGRGVHRVEDYQRWFTGRVREHLERRGRRLVGWDEIVDAGPVPGALIMAWRRARFGVRAAESGQEVVMAPNEATYLDHAPSTDPGEPGAHHLGTTRLDQVHAFDPLRGVPSPAHSAVAGTQFQLWTERVPTPQVAEYLVFPRACALAEVAWSPAGGGFDEFQARLETAHLPRLDALGVNYRPLDGPRPWQRVAPPGP